MLYRKDSLRMIVYVYIMVGCLAETIHKEILQYIFVLVFKTEEKKK